MIFPDIIFKRLQSSIIICIFNFHKTWSYWSFLDSESKYNKKLEINCSKREKKQTKATWSYSLYKKNTIAYLLLFVRRIVRKKIKGSILWIYTPNVYESFKEMTKNCKYFRYFSSLSSVDSLFLFNVPNHTKEEKWDKGDTMLKNELQNKQNTGAFCWEKYFFKGKLHDVCGGKEVFKILLNKCTTYINRFFIQVYT